MAILYWLLFGLVAGLIAKAIMPGRVPGGFIVTAVLGIAGAAAGHDGNVIEPEGPPRRLPDADLDLSHEAASLLTAVRGPREGPH